MASPVTISNQLPETCREILRCEVGSSAHGVSLPGQDDFDMMAIAVERPPYVTGISIFEHKIYRTAEERAGRPNVPSQPGDIDLTIYSLRKFARLAAQGNPTVLMMLYGPVLASDEFGEKLRQHKHLFSSRQVGKRFLGYMTAQKERLKGERGQMRTTRQDLIDAYGYDTKYAMHVLRLGYQGTIFMAGGGIPVPIDEPFRQFLIGLRQGKESFETVIEMAEDFEQTLVKQIKNGTLPENPDIEGINALLRDIYIEAWDDGFEI